MKLKFTFLLICLSINIHSQEIMSYERNIDNQKKFIFFDYTVLQIKESITLKGTLITPKEDYNKIVIIVPGSGKDTRNSHFQLTEYLLENNIAVFRYDERGVGLSNGKYSNSSYTITNMIDDLCSIYEKLKADEKLVNKKIGLLGHSQGGIITIGSIDKGLKCDFIVQWATPIQRASDFFKYQIKTGVNKQVKTLNYKNDEMKYAVIDSIQKIIDLHIELDNITLIKTIYKSLKKMGYDKDDFGWYISFPSYLDLLKKNYISTYKDISIPMLYIIGDNDVYVDPDANVKLLEGFGNDKINIKKFKSLNHYLNTNDLKELNQSIYEIEIEPKQYICNWILTI